MGRLAQDEAHRQKGRPVVRSHIRVTGLVQGVGFRPHVYRLATELGLAGWVLNSPSGVTIEVEGAAGAVEEFARQLRARPPRLARVLSLEATAVPVTGELSFEIVPSLDDGGRQTLVSPDIATCEACREEFLTPGDRRFGYPFTNCTDCGPRYSIIDELPYDRPLTSMRVFPMCPECRREYESPADRRFHAQPNACPVCGPRVWLEDAEGRVIAEGAGRRAPASGWATAFRGLVKDGAIVAVKGLGGFHLACDARSEEAVTRLRARKRRPAKPFAVMVRNLAAARRYVEIGPEAKGLLTSPAAPIVILPVRPPAVGDTHLPGAGADSHAGDTRLLGAGADSHAGAAPSLAPGSSTLGLMLAYTPLHFHLFDEDLDLLVMTSANPSGLPIIKDNEEARSRLGEIADYFVLHDREIVNRCEDSVVRVVESDGRPDPGAAREPSGPSALVIPYRRSRGYAPGAIDVAGSLPGPVAGPAGSAPAATPAHTPTGSAFGAGGEMKSVFCFVRDGQAFLSPHLGEMDYVESLDAYRDAYERYSLLLDSPVALAGYDPHPGYLVSRLARRLAGPEAVHLPVYHHHAHMVSCLADNGLAGDSPVLGLICDGTGYGPDGAVWGFELLAGTAAGFTRLGHLANTFMPGGDVVARRPYRAAAAHLYRVLGKEGVERLARLRPDAREELHLAAGLLEAGARSGSSPTDRPACAPQDLTSSCGRLYDAVAAMAAVAVENTYEGQAAVELSEAGDFHRAGALEELMESPPRPYRFSVNAGAGGDGPHHSTAAAGGDGPILIDPQPFLTGLLADLDRERAVGRRGVDRRAVSRLFHRSLIEAMVGAVQAGAARTGLARVCLSGGTFQNPYLVAALRPRLEAAGLEVFTHRQVPPNDGGLALGQAVAAVWMARPQEELNPLVSGRSGTHHQP